MSLRKRIASVSIALTLVVSGSVALGTVAQGATCNGVAGEYSGGYTISTVAAGSSCAQTRARTYTYVGGGVSITTYGNWATQSIAYKDASGSYSGGGINARYPTKFWGDVPGSLNTNYLWSYS